MGASEERNTIRIAENGSMLYLPVAAGEKIFQGTLVAVDATGNAVSGKKATGLRAAGRAEHTVDNTGGAAGALCINVQRGAFIWDNDPVAAGTLKQANVLGNCYIADNCTVTAADTGASAAGRVLAVTDDGVAVEII